MRILELEINNIRGITHTVLNPNSKNFVVWGPNGSGKSAVVDAIDFLLTGRVSRLTGPGCGEITLKKHGPHIDHNPQEAIVRAKIKLSNIPTPIEITRCMANPHDLKYTDPSTKSYLDPIITLAYRGQHVLTRREILKYITAESGTRAQEIQELLNITEIEDVRKIFVKVQHDIESEVKTNKSILLDAQRKAAASVGEIVYTGKGILDSINKNRALLSGQPITGFQSKNLKTGITPPSMAPGKPSINASAVKRNIEIIKNLIGDQNQKQIAESDKKLRSLIITIKTDSQLKLAYDHRELAILGIKLIDESGKCPLCGTSWPSGKLIEHIEQQLSKAKIATQYYDEIDKLSGDIENYINKIILSIDEIVSIIQLIKLSDTILVLQAWANNLKALLCSLKSPMEKYPDSRFDSDSVKRMLSPDNITQVFDGINLAVEGQILTTSPEQAAWDILTRLEENLKSCEIADIKHREIELFQKRATILLDSFLKSRDIILGKLYDDIQNRFISLYRQLHGIDEDKFIAIIKPEGAGLDIKVDFHGRGTHPPHALHSEGHQDSMGLCLYLALAERLTEGFIDLIILDDVVMSVDADHRRQVCSLLKNGFTKRQFLITTHDKTWATQLKQEGVVRSEESIEFYNWRIETGPQVNEETDIWNRIKKDLSEDDVPSASAKLRRGSEEFFGTVCDRLQAKVIFRESGKWELGDFLPAAMTKYKELLNKAKKSAQSWGKQEQLELLKEHDTIMSQIYERLNIEQWNINASLHYNNWANFKKNDFQPVVDAFQDLYGLFSCSKCGSMLYLAIVKMEPTNVRCSCEKVNLNLTVRDDKEIISSVPPPRNDVTNV